MYPLKSTVWYGVHANGIIGPYFFRNEEGAADTVDGVQYPHTLNTFLFPKMQQLNINISLFQQDNATCHSATETINLLNGQFDNNVNLRNGPVN